MSRIDEIRERLELIKNAQTIKQSNNQKIWLEEHVVSNTRLLLSKLEIAEKALEELQRYTAPEYPFKTADTIAEFHTLIGMALQQLRS